MSKEKPLEKLLLEMQLELLIRRKKLDKFKEEVAVNAVIYSIRRAIRVLENGSS